MRIVLAALLLTACAAPPSPQAPQPLTPTTFKNLPGWRADEPGELHAAFALQCARLARLAPETPLGGADLARAYAGRAAAWREPCAALPPAADDAAMRRFVEAWFQPYEITAPALLTGYYEPLVRGALAPSPATPVPVLARPPDLVEVPGAAGGAPRIGRGPDALTPYWSRAEIEAGRAPARPLLYLADPIDVFFLQIQGAGRVLLPDGSTVRLAFAGSNGRPYTPIGRILVAAHAMAEPDVTMQSIRAWLAAHPAEARTLMDRNAHYVFFRVAAGASGPVGALGVPLTPGRSAAIDRRALPLGAPLFLVTRDPVSGGIWRHLVLAQDTGTDMLGPARADIFLGAGPGAERMAGAMHEPGTAYLLLPRPAVTQTARLGS